MSGKLAARFLAAAGFLLCAGAAWSEQQVSMTWDALGPAVTGKKIALVLPDGTQVEGKARGVEPAGLRLKISKTSNKNVQPKGEHVIPRQSVSLLRVTDYRKIGRLIGTAGALAICASFLALGARDTSISEGPLVIVLPIVAGAGTAGAGVGGYYFGKAIDKRVKLIRIVPGN